MPVPWPLPVRSVTALRRRLNAWFDAEQRPLPWRDVDDPYKVWVSEIMLQQTRVDTVWAYYERWLKRFPDVEALAGASLEDVYRCWSGLGYYNRARNLHEAARRVVNEHAGRLPESAQDLCTLPGVGAYTAGAVASIAFGEAVPAVDGNAVRVLSRLTGERGVVERPATKRKLTEVARGLVDPKRPGEWNQAIMELGATLCTPREPSCGKCPVSRWCVAHEKGWTDRVPRVQPKRPVARETVQFAFVQSGGRILMTRRPERGLLAGTWGLPGGPPGRLGRAVREQTGVRVRKGRRLGEAEHRFTHRHWLMEIYGCNIVPDDPWQNEEQKGDGFWVDPDALTDAPLAKATRKALAAAGVQV